MMQATQSSKSSPAQVKRAARLQLLKKEGKMVKKEDMKFLEKVGSGVQSVAWKTLFKGKKTVTAKFTKPHKTDQLLEEAALLARVPHHNNVIHLEGYCDFIKFGSVSGPVLLTSFCDGQLRYLLETNAFSLKDLVGFASQLVAGMEHLHKNHILHRDLSLRNVLYCYKDGKYRIKIADFGMSAVLEGVSSYQISEPVLVAFCWAPLEVLQDGIYSFASDVYSGAITLWEMLTIKQPFHSSTSVSHQKKLLSSKVILEKPSNCPQELYDILTVCWDEKDKRPSAQELQQMLKKFRNSFKFKPFHLAEMKVQLQNNPEFSECWNAVASSLDENEVNLEELVAEIFQRNRDYEFFFGDQWKNHSSATENIHLTTFAQFAKLGMLSFFTDHLKFSENRATFLKNKVDVEIQLKILKEIYNKTMQCINNNSHALHKIGEAIQQVEDSFSAPSLRIALIGNSLTGKSTLLNALVGSELKVAEGIEPETRDVTEVTAKDLYQNISNSNSMRNTSEGLPAVLPIKFVDCPGLGGDSDLMERTLTEMKKADAILYVLPFNVPFNEEFKEQIRTVISSTFTNFFFYERFFVVLTCGDIVETGYRPPVFSPENFEDKWSKAIFETVIPNREYEGYPRTVLVSSLWALASRTDQCRYIAQQLCITRDQRQRVLRLSRIPVLENIILNHVCDKSSELFLLSSLSKMINNAALPLLSFFHWVQDQEVQKEKVLGTLTKMVRKMLTNLWEVLFSADQTCDPTREEDKELLEWQIKHHNQNCFQKLATQFQSIDKLLGDSMPDKPDILSIWKNLDNSNLETLKQYFFSQVLTEYQEVIMSTVDSFSVPKHPDFEELRDKAYAVREEMKRLLRKIDENNASNNDSDLYFDYFCTREKSDELKYPVMDNQWFEQLERDIQRGHNIFLVEEKIKMWNSFKELKELYNNQEFIKCWKSASKGKLLQLKVDVNDLVTAIFEQCQLFSNLFEEEWNSQQHAEDQIALSFFGQYTKTGLLFFFLDYLGMKNTNGTFLEWREQLKQINKKIAKVYDERAEVYDCVASGILEFSTKFKSPISRIVLIGDDSMKTAFLSSLLAQTTPTNLSIVVEDSTQDHEQPFRSLPFTGTIVDDEDLVLAVRFAGHDDLKGPHKENHIPPKHEDDIVFYFPTLSFNHDFEKIKARACKLRHFKEQFFVILVSQPEEHDPPDPSLQHCSEKIFKTVFEEEEYEGYPLCLKANLADATLSPRKTTQENGLQDVERCLLNIFTTLTIPKIKHLSAVTLTTVTKLFHFLDITLVTSIGEIDIQTVKRYRQLKVQSSKPKLKHDKEHYALLQPTEDHTAFWGQFIAKNKETVKKLAHKTQKLMWDIIFCPVKQKHRTLTDKMVDSWINKLICNDILELQQQRPKITLKTFKEDAAEQLNGMKTGVMFSLVKEINIIMAQ